MPAIRNQGAFITSRRLREILAVHPRYRRRWQQRAKRAREDLHQAAIAEVITLHLWDCGELSENIAPRTLKDRVSRALNGSIISPETLRWFIEAFEMEDYHREELWGALFGENNPDLGVAHTLRNRRAMAKRQRHRTINLVERYSVDPNRSLLWRKTFHAIRAVEDNVDTYFFNHEPWASRIEVLHGGTLGDRYSYGDGLTGVDILLANPLAAMQATALEYQAHYEPIHSKTSEIRRPAFARVENVDIAVEFTSSDIPRKIWWCIWDDHIDNRPVWEEEWNIRGHVARKYIPFIEEAVVGFRWEW
ncbi:hypothetical protein ACFVQ0_10540 [Streptomyces sp. NPDC057900]|uniref:hypothetical protein n=1 Tax=Streptomyces sp. NPDC057900 TaxID=3346274 RepID=UPI0036EFB48E